MTNEQTEQPLIKYRGEKLTRLKPATKKNIDRKKILKTAKKRNEKSKKTKPKETKPKSKDYKRRVKIVKRSIEETKKQPAVQVDKNVIRKIVLDELLKQQINQAGMAEQKKPGVVIDSRKKRALANIETAKTAQQLGIPLSALKDITDTRLGAFDNTLATLRRIQEAEELTKQNEELRRRMENIERRLQPGAVQAIQYRAAQDVPQLPEPEPEPEPQPQDVPQLPEPEPEPQPQDVPQLPEPEPEPEPQPQPQQFFIGPQPNIPAHRAKVLKRQIEELAEGQKAISQEYSVPPRAKPEPEPEPESAASSSTTDFWQHVVNSAEEDSALYGLKEYVDVNSKKFFPSVLDLMSEGYLDKATHREVYNDMLKEYKKAPWITNKGERSLLKDKQYLKSITDAYNRGMGDINDSTLNETHEEEIEPFEISPGEYYSGEGLNKSKYLKKYEQRRKKPGQTIIKGASIPKITPKQYTLNQFKKLVLDEPNRITYFKTLGQYDGKDIYKQLVGAGIKIKGCSRGKGCESLREYIKKL